MSDPLNADPHVGDFIVTLDWGTYRCSGPVTKVTPQQVRCASLYRNAENRTALYAILFAGTEVQIKGLVERLASSLALHKKEASASYGRHQDRVRKLIQKAVIARATAPEPSRED